MNPSPEQQHFYFDTFYDCTLDLVEMRLMLGGDKLKDLARERFKWGMHLYGAEMFGWDRERLIKEIDEELADALIYMIALMALAKEVGQDKDK